tara:strand:- start:1490 stop:1792 length:303 start_codon:yes stop_codon:yes gene_type:complete
MFLALLKLINWFLTEKPSAPIVVELTSEKIIMETKIEPVAQVRDWAIARIQSLHDQDGHKNAVALIAEFDEWLDIPEGTEEIDYLCIEEDGWGDQEVDVR